MSIKHYHDNIIDSNHGNGTQLNQYFKVFKKHRVNDRVFTLLLCVGVGTYTLYKYHALIQYKYVKYK